MKNQRADLGVDATLIHGPRWIDFDSSWEPCLSKGDGNRPRDRLRHPIKWGIVIMLQKSGHHWCQSTGAPSE